MHAWNTNEDRLYRYLGTEGAKGIRVLDSDGQEHVLEIEARDFFTMDLTPGRELVQVFSDGSWRRQGRPKF